MYLGHSSQSLSGFGWCFYPQYGDYLIGIGKSQSLSGFGWYSIVKRTMPIKERIDVTSQLVCDVPIAVPIMAGTSPATTENDTPFRVWLVFLLPLLGSLKRWLCSLNPFQGLVGVSTPPARTRLSPPSRHNPRGQFCCPRLYPLDKPASSG